MNFRAAARAQAEGCARLGSPFTARLCRLFAQNLAPGTPVADRVLGWPGDCSHRGGAVALRLAGALHALVLRQACAPLCAAYPPDDLHHDDAALWAAIETALGQHSDFVLGWLDSPPQTNEVGRAGGLIPAFHALARHLGLPLVISELGASAGLNTNWPAYRLVLKSGTWGPENAALVLTPDWSGPPPPHADLKIRDRAACDLNPLSPTRASDRLRLMSYLWPDQPERLARLKTALDIAARAGGAGVAVQRAEAANWLKMRLSHRAEGALHVIFHTIAWQYFPEETATRCTALLGAAGDRASRSAPLAWLRVEADATGGDGAPIRLTLWPGGDQHCLGRMDFHGAWVKWTGLPPRTREAGPPPHGSC